VEGIPGPFYCYLQSSTSYDQAQHYGARHSYIVFPANQL